MSSAALAAPCPSSLRDQGLPAIITLVARLLDLIDRQHGCRDNPAYKAVWLCAERSFADHQLVWSLDPQR